MRRKQLACARRTLDQAQGSLAKSRLDMLDPAPSTPAHLSLTCSLSAGARRLDKVKYSTVDTVACKRSLDTDHAARKVDIKPQHGANCCEWKGTHVENVSAGSVWAVYQHYEMRTVRGRHNSLSVCRRLTHEYDRYHHVQSRCQQSKSKPLCKP